MKNNIFKIAFAVWVVLWAWFLVRELFVKDNIDTYRALLQRSLEGKRSYVTGDKLYEFLMFCKGKMPDHSSYKIVGLEDGSIEKRRAVYYLYPHLESNEPAYILDTQKYILKKNDGA
ncbi:MAG: hypothetical protein NTW09_02745 [Candidatus Omnitrophica bacterium]|nr:hypothetical protein [Candidatus Omnitrophota bacterium]